MLDPTDMCQECESSSVICALVWQLQRRSACYCQYCIHTETCSLCSTRAIHWTETHLGAEHVLHQLASVQKIKDTIVKHCTLVCTSGAQKPCVGATCIARGMQRTCRA